MTGRIRSVAGVVLLLMVLLVGQLTYLQLVEARLQLDQHHHHEQQQQQQRLSKYPKCHSQIHPAAR